MKIIALALLAFSTIPAYSQEAVDLIESTLKLGISEEKEFYFGFAEGDQIVLNVEVVKGKSIGEVEVAEYPSFTKFSDYETSGIVDKKIQVSKREFINLDSRIKDWLGKFVKYTFNVFP